MDYGCQTLKRPQPKGKKKENEDHINLEPEDLYDQTATAFENL